MWLIKRHLLSLSLALLINLGLLVGLWLLQRNVTPAEEEKPQEIVHVINREFAASEETAKQEAVEDQQTPQPQLMVVAAPAPDVSVEGVIEVPTLDLDLVELDFTPELIAVQEQPFPKRNAAEKAGKKPSQQPRAKPAQQTSNAAAVNVERVHGTHELDQSPRLLKMVRPVYPSVERNRNIEGTVRLLITIDKQGRVASAEVLEASRANFQRAVLRVVKRWRFSPGKKDGQAVSSKLILPYRFVME